jgi:hypothetical protein
MKKKRTRKKAPNSSFLRRNWDKLKNWGESSLSWLEWNTHTLWSLGLIAFGAAMLWPSIAPWTVIAYVALSVGGIRLLLDLKERWM